MLTFSSTQIYALAAGGAFTLLLLYRACTRIYRYAYARTIIFFLRYIIYPFAFQRQRWLGPITRFHLILQLLYWGGVTLYNSIGVTSLAQAGSRAGTLSLIHLIPLFFGNHLSFAADVVGLSIRTYRFMHYSLGFMTFVLGMFHVAVTTSQSPKNFFGDQALLYGLIGICIIALLLIMSLSLFRRPSYEFFLRSHQALAVAAAVAIWRHLSVKKLFDRLYILIAGGLFAITLLVESAVFLARNLVFRQSRVEADIVRKENQLAVTLILPRALKVHAGQYINITIPGASFWSFTQSHPMSIAWWTDGANPALYLLVEPKTGWTERLLSIAHPPRFDDNNRETVRMEDHYLAAFSGPHGQAADVSEYGSVLLIATGMGIATQLSYVKELIQGYNSGEARTRRVHLVWQLDHWDEYHFQAENVLNRILSEDIKDDGYIFQMSIWVAHGYPFTEVPHSEGIHGRLHYYNGIEDLGKLLAESVEKKRGKMLVTVSGTATIRDQLRKAIPQYVDQGVRFSELEFQPEPTNRFWRPRRKEIQAHV